MITNTTCPPAGDPDKKYKYGMQKKTVFSAGPGGNYGCVTLDPPESRKIYLNGCMRLFQIERINNMECDPECNVCPYENDDYKVCDGCVYYDDKGLDWLSIYGSTYAPDCQPRAASNPDSIDKGYEPTGAFRGHLQ